MIGLAATALPARTAAKLATLQAAVSGAGDYAAQVAAAKVRWTSRPRPLFKTVHTHLVDLCSGNRRCVYCEDSWADEIEHMRPKDLYPNQVFDWSNYVLACGPCNGPKNSMFAVLDEHRRLVSVTRRRADPVMPPLGGSYALIDPRVEDPLLFLWLDFGTGIYAENSDDPTSIEWQRARYTIDLLRLNQRADLVRGRRAAYTGFMARLDDYIARRAHLSAAGVEELRDHLRAERYGGVWKRMKEYRALYSDLEQRFAVAPEVLGW